jgi:hypothetical protein
MYEELVSPAVVNPPPIYKSVPIAFIVLTAALTPPPTGLHLAPFQRAMYLAAVLPREVKVPPTYKSDPRSAIE